MTPTRRFVDAATFNRFVDAYSADRMSEERPVKVARFKGVLYTTTGITTNGRTVARGRASTIEARRLYPLKEWPGRTTPATYSKRAGSSLRGERFYDGMLVRHGGVDYVLGRDRVEIRLARVKERA